MGCDTSFGRQSAYSLVELSVVLSIVAILVALAYPTVIRLFAQMEANRVAQVLEDSLKQARAMSLVGRHHVVVCVADAYNQCHKRASDRVLVFHDADDNQQLDAGELIAEHALGLNYGYTDLRVSLGRHYVRYFGTTATPKGHFGHVKYCSELQELSYKVVLTHLGRVYVSKEGVGC